MTKDQIDAVLILFGLIAAIFTILVASATIVYYYEVRENKKQRANEPNWYHFDHDSILDPYPYE